MAVFGLQDEIADVPVKDEQEEAEDQEKFEIWPENVTTLKVFLAMENQWDKLAFMTGDVVPTRMIFEALPTVLSCTKGVRKKDWPDIFQHICAMEKAALKVFNKQQERKAKR